MKKITLILLSIISFLFCLVWVSVAAETDIPSTTINSQESSSSQQSSNNNKIKVTVTEKIPGAWCEWPEWGPYTCNVEAWFWTVTSMMWAIIKYATFLAALSGVLFIVYNWIMYSMGWIEQSLKDNAKKRIVQTLIWLAVLFLSWVILNLVAPWVYVK